MNRVRITTKSLYGLLVAVFCCAYFACAALGESIDISVVDVKGRVDMMASSSLEWTGLINGDRVPGGAILRTGQASSCMLKWAGGNVIKLDALTVLTVYAERESSGAEKSRVSLTTGKVFAHAKKLVSFDSNFEIRTPTAVAGVRGTDLYGTMDNGQAGFGVTEGSVSVSAGGGEVTVEAGMSVSVDETGAVSEPEPIPADIIQEVEGSMEEVSEEGAALEQENQSEQPVQSEPAGQAEVVQEPVEQTLPETPADETAEDDGTEELQTMEEVGGDVVEGVVDDIDSTLEQMLIEETQNQIEYGKVEMDIYIDSQ
ncbi:FecR domain-containing protein [bacterium]